MDLQKKIHNRTWFKKCSKNCFYITQVAVSKQSRESGIFRKMIIPVIEDCERKNMDIVLETFTKSNVQMYEHFGFELVETHASDEVPFSDYCMIKKCKRGLETSSFENHRCKERCKYTPCRHDHCGKCWVCYIVPHGISNAIMLNCC